MEMPPHPLSTQLLSQVTCRVASTVSVSSTLALALEIFAWMEKQALKQEIPISLREATSYATQHGKTPKGYSPKQAGCGEVNLS